MSILMIIPLQLHHLPPVKEIIIQASFEYQLVRVKTLEELRILCKAANFFEDLDNFQKYYDNKKSIFLVMLDGDKVIGMGGILFNSPEICELRRLFFEKSYRGKGLGSKMLSELLNHAERLEYHSIRLELYNASTQIAAYNFYKKFGFYEINSYKQGSPAQICMQKDLK